MKECPRQSADDLEIEALSEADGALVRGDDEVELHGAEAAEAGLVEGMGAHRPSDAATGLTGRRHVTAVRKEPFAECLRFTGTRRPDRGIKDDQWPSGCGTTAVRSSVRQRGRCPISRRSPAYGNDSSPDGSWGSVPFIRCRNSEIDW